MNIVPNLLLAIAGLVMAANAAAQVTLYERDGFQGLSVTTETTVLNLERWGFNDRASSAVVVGSRFVRWEVCENRRLRGRCVVLRPGRYASLAAMGLNDRISSVRAVARNARVSEERYAPLPPPPTSNNQVVLFEAEGFGGRTFTTETAVADFRRSGFNDRASSAIVSGERWEVCQDTQFGGPCAILRPGRYPSLTAMGLNDRISSVRTVGRPQAEAPRGVPVPAPPVSQAVFYENEGFRGRSFTADAAVTDLRQGGFNDQASSVVVSGGHWEVCQDARFGAPCVVLRPGQYPSLQAMGLNDRISSVRGLNAAASVEERRYAPMPMVSRDYGRRNNERLFEADITSVRAVVEDSGQRCWVEREQAVQEGPAGANVPGALIGAVIGGILGHQVGGGTGRDVATGVGAIAGATIGGSAGRNDNQQIVRTQDVQRCRTVPGQARPAYWDVTYSFRGQEYRVQMTTRPGSTVTVNERGEPRA